jgi:hypothetical protein
MAYDPSGWRRKAERSLEACRSGRLVGQGRILVRVVTVWSLVASSAGAEDVSPACRHAPEVCGRRAFEQGTAAYRSGDYARALSWFREAQAVRPHPSILFNVALAEAKTGLPVEALGHLEQVFSDPETPPDLLEVVGREREHVSSQVATVSVDNPDVELFVDGRQAPGAPPRLRVNPGQHQIRLVRQGRVVVDRVVMLKPADRVEVAVASPHADPQPSPAPLRPLPPPADLGPARSGRRGLSPWWVAGGAGLTGLVGAAAVYSYVATSQAFEDFKRDLPKLTRDEAERRIDQGQSMETRTYWLLTGTAALAAATGVVAAVWTDWSGQGPGVRAGFGGDRLEVQARF